MISSQMDKGEGIQQREPNNGCGREGRRKGSRTPLSCSQGNHRLLPDLLISHDGGFHFSDMFFTSPECEQAGAEVVGMGV